MSNLITILIIIIIIIIIMIIRMIIKIKKQQSLQLNFTPSMLVF